MAAGQGKQENNDGPYLRFLNLNGKLITLPHIGAATYSDAGLSVTHHELPGTGNAGLAEEQMTVMFPGAKGQHGFRGYRACSGGPFR